MYAKGELSALMIEIYTRLYSNALSQDATYSKRFRDTSFDVIKKEDEYHLYIFKHDSLTNMMYLHYSVYRSESIID